MLDKNDVAIPHGHNFQHDRDHFDDSLRKFLVKSVQVFVDEKDDPDLAARGVADYVETTALADFFATTHSPLAVLLHQTGIRKYLTRPIDQVELAPETSEPILSKFEHRIYNLAARNDREVVPFRFVPAKRQNEFGDSILPEPERDDCGNYFTTRRADLATTQLMTDWLENVAKHSQKSLPIHVVRPEGRTIRQCLAVAVEHAHSHGQSPHGYIIQSRHDGADRHFGTMLAILNGQHPGHPDRLIFFDTYPNDRKQEKDKYVADFRNAIDHVFPAQANHPVSAMAEDCSIGLWRAPREDASLPRRHYDLDCSFYTFTMARAVIQLACDRPDLILKGDVKAIKAEMKAHMPEYFTDDGILKSDAQRREVNIGLRWKVGQQALLQMAPWIEPVRIAEPVVSAPASHLAALLAHPTPSVHPENNLLI